MICVTIKFKLHSKDHPKLKQWLNEYLSQRLYKHYELSQFHLDLVSHFVQSNASVTSMEHQSFARIFENLGIQVEVPNGKTLIQVIVENVFEQLNEVLNYKMNVSLVLPDI